MRPEVRVLPSAFYAQIAQLVEQGTENPCVGGSIPPLGTFTITINQYYNAYGRRSCCSALLSGEESPDSKRGRCWITSSEGNLRESAAETIPPLLQW